MSLDEIVNQVSNLALNGGITVASVLAIIGMGYVAYKAFRSKWDPRVYGEDTDKKEKIKKKDQRLIARIPIEGVLVNFPSKSMSMVSDGHYALPRRIIKDIKNAVDDRRVKGIVFDVNCRGGEIQPSEELADYISTELQRETKESIGNRKKNPHLERKFEKIPSVALIKGYGASGGYLVSTATDYIIAHNTSLVGSIGVFAVRPDVSKFLKDWGIEVIIYKKGKNKAEGLPFTPVTDTEKENQKKLITEVYHWFIDSVYQNREKYLTREEVEELATGGAILGADALECKLIDEIGGFTQAVKALEKLGQFDHTDVIDYKKESPDLSALLPLLSKPQGQLPYAIDKILEIFNLYNDQGIMLL